MSVIPLTVFFSLLLAGLFMGLFLFERRGGRFMSAERDSLLPLADERPAGAGPGGHAHDHHGEACGCRRGVRTPCAGCLKRRDEQDPAHFLNPLPSLSS